MCNRLNDNMKIIFELIDIEDSIIFPFLDTNKVENIAINGGD